MITWIADIGSNHNRNIDRCKELIKTAKGLGCEYVKFQLFKAEKLYDSKFKKQIKQIKERELPIGFLPEIKNECIKNKIKFACTPFDLDSVDILKEFVDMYKIGSYELLHKELIKKVMNTNKEWSVSLGMCDDIIYTLSMFLDNPKIRKNNPKYVFHCNSNYPASKNNCDLSTITFISNTLKMCFSSNFVQVGWSDHTVDDDVIISAIGTGAQVIELHLDLEDKKGLEFAHGHCWTPIGMQRLMNGVDFISNTSFIGKVNKSFLRTETNQEECKKWRTDPADGKRPLKKYREELLKNT